MKSRILVYLPIISGVILIYLAGCHKSEDQPKVTDIDGNAYNIITIGSQIWMKENLKVTRYNDGTSIPNVTDSTAWGALTTGAYCWYNNYAPLYKVSYGGLYNWYAVNTGKLCPAGWHVPSDWEWHILALSMDPLAQIDSSQEIESESAGSRLKEAGSAHWINNNSDVNNASGFTALPGGARNMDGKYFYSSGLIGVWWTADDLGLPYSIVRLIETDQFYSDELFRKRFYNAFGLSVRCIKD